MPMTQNDQETYFLHANLPAFRRKVIASMNIIRNSLAMPGNWMISFSAGKDSIVLLDMLVSAGWRGMGFHCICSEFEDPPENAALTQKLNKKYGTDIRIVNTYGEADAWNEVGYFFAYPQTKAERKAASKANTEFKRASQQFMVENGINNIFLGLRKEESRGRAINLRMRGDTYVLKDGRMVCCPLANWTGRDIWAYIALHDLEYLSCYDNPITGRERMRNELTVLYDRDLVGRGVMVQYRACYPELYAKLAREHPEVRCYV